jgi:hypothetical protein
MNQYIDRGSTTMRHHADPGDQSLDAEALAALATAGDAEPAPEACHRWRGAVAGRRSIRRCATIAR